MFTRRQFLAYSAGTGLALTHAGRLAWGDVENTLPDGSMSRGMITPAAQKAIDQGLDFLSRNQHGDGSFGTGHHHGNVAITSLGALAMMAGGHQPGRGAYGKVVRKALEYVLRQEKGRRGYLYNKV